MWPLTFTAGVMALASFVAGQSTKYCDPLTSICYQSYTTSAGVTFRIALPNVSTAPYDAILQIVAPVSNKWVGVALGGRMTYDPLIVAWPNGNSVVASSRMAYGYNLPQAYANATYTLMKGTAVNSTSWTLTVRCKGCSSWLDSTLNTTNLDPTNSQAQIAWAQSNTAVITPASNTSTFNVHDSTGGWSMDLASARSSSFDAWVANNLLVSTTSSGTVPALTTTSSSTIATSTTSTIATIPISSGTTIAIPTSCPGVAAVKYSGQVATGWRAVKIAGGLTTPRGIIMDTAGHLLVVENGKGITIRTLGSDGCVASSKTLIPQTNLNHGIYLTPDGKTLYASSMTTVWKWSYDPVTMTVGSSTIVVNGMYNGGHPTRTLIIPKNKPNLLVVSHGSLENLDLPSGNLATQRAVIKVFDMNSVPSGGYNFVSGGYQAGYGLRNEVGLAFDTNNMLWGVENSSDDITRTVNGVATDIHIDNPAEELNYLGDVSVANNKWYGYPTCFTVWGPSAIKDKTFSIGDQFVLAPNSTFDDSTCISKSTPARLSFQAHSAPLDNKFDNTYSNMYVSFHGSWDRTPPTGFKLVVVPFSKGSDGSYTPTAPANSGSGYKDIWWNTDVTQCSTTNCFRPVGIWIDAVGRLFVTSDASGEGELFLLGPSSGTTPVTSSSSLPVTSTTSKPATTLVTSASSMVPPPVSTTTPAGPAQTHYGQCGGQDWKGATTCASPYTCKYSNAWYSQCL